VFETYEEPSIKDLEHNRREKEDAVYVITGPDQVRPKDISKALKSPSFKQQLPRFLMKEWASEHHAHVLSGREIFLGVDGECVQFCVVNDRVERQLVARLNCNHPEADTRLCLHMIDADAHMPTGGDIVVRATDTDVLVMLLHHLHRVGANVWMEVGTSGRGNRRYVNVSAIACKLGPECRAALPAFHAYTGCDYTAAFARKGKKRPFAQLEKDDRFLQAFASMATNPVDEFTLQTIQDYTCALYGSRKSVSLNSHRYKVFEKAYGPKDTDKPLQTEGN